MSNFEIACKTPGSGDLIIQCIADGCEVNQVIFYYRLSNLLILNFSKHYLIAAEFKI